MNWEMGLSTATGVLVTLLGVAVGAWMSNRSQSRAWSRSVLTDTSAALLQEQATTDMGLVRWRSKEIERVDWAGWNAALARVQLVGPPSIVEAALKLDAAFWSIGTGIRENVDEVGWCQLRDEVELRRLEFVNAARQQLSPSTAPLHRLVGKPDRANHPDQHRP
ncbi:hypothetical protein ACLQ3H_23965 [Micromonospora saelicesensis]|uniref:hypothetical protein n=1 Tax=Micromonospora saelicesensis TaxID=285676 RepID=UPI003CE8D74A